MPEADLKKLLLQYSFDDLAKTFFALNLWLPNIASPIKSQYLYVKLESVCKDLPHENKIKSYEDFKTLCTEILKFIPSFPSIEDYVPEADWGDIKYFFKKQFFKIFYGGDLSNPYDFYYSFEIIHRNFEDYYLEHIKRSALKEFQFCLGLQNYILENLPQDEISEDDLQPGDFDCPTEGFWQSAVAFIDGFDPNKILNPALVDLYTQKCESSLDIKLDEFSEKAFEGKNCQYFFLKKDSKYYPALPRRYFSVLLDSWGRVLKDNYAKITQLEKFKKPEIGLSIELSVFLKERIDEDDFFELASPLNSELKPSELVFSTIRSKNKLFLIYTTPPSISKELIENHLKDIVPQLNKCREILKMVPMRLGLMARQQAVEFKDEKENTTLVPVFIVVIPYCSSEILAIGIPKELEAEVVGLDQFSGIVDEIDGPDELSDFFDFLKETDASGRIIALNSLLDKFGSFRDSYGVLVPGAMEPNFITLDFGWGSSIRYRSLTEFWKVFPEEILFGHPRSWTIPTDRRTKNGFILKSKKFFSYAYYQKIGDTSFFINAPVHRMKFEQGTVSDTMMQSLADSFDLYSGALSKLTLTKQKNKVQVIFFPFSLVERDNELKHVKHLLQTTELWKMDIVSIGPKDYGVRVVYNDGNLLTALKDVKDRTIQINLLIDVLKELTNVWPEPDLSSVIAELEKEKSKPARFKAALIRKKASFPAGVKLIIPDQREYKMADKEIAKIANDLGIQPGTYGEADAKIKLNTLVDKLLEKINLEVSNFDLEKSIPLLLEKIDALVAEHEQTDTEIKISLEHEVDYKRDEESAEAQKRFIHFHKAYRYLVEKFVQLKPTGKELDLASLKELVALVDILLDIRYASDFLHYGIYPAKIEIGDDFLVLIKYEVNILEMERDFGTEQAKINLGQIGNKEDVPDTQIPIIDYLEDIDTATKEDFGFSFKDLVNVQQVMSLWAEYNKGVSEKAYYSATPDEISTVCVASIKGYDPSKTELILDFLTLKSEKLLTIEGDNTQAKDLPIWEHIKRATRYTLRPLIKIGDKYFWGPHSIEKASHTWSGISSANRLPADIYAPHLVAALDRGHRDTEGSLVRKGEEIISRFTRNVKLGVFPHNFDSSINDIGDYDILAFIENKNILLNIESKIIDPAFSLKDLGRIQRKIFGRTKEDGTFEKGDLQRVEEREQYLINKGTELMAKLGWNNLATKPKIVSVFLTRAGYWWTKFPPIKSNVKFIEIRLLESFIKNI